MRYVECVRITEIRSLELQVGENDNAFFEREKNRGTGFTLERFLVHLDVR